MRISRGISHFPRKAPLSLISCLLTAISQPLFHGFCTFAISIPPLKIHSRMNLYKLSSHSQLKRLWRLYYHCTVSSSSGVADPHPLQILWRYQILDPDSDIVAYWNHVFLITSITALFIDPLFFFLPYVGPDSICLSIDSHLAVTITYFRSIADLFFLLHMLMKFRTAFIAPSSKVFGRGELVMDAKQIALRYLKSDFVVDLAATLPLPQIVIWLVIPATRINRADHTNNTLSLIVLIQYIPRMFVIFPLQQRIIKTTDFVAKSAWIGAAYNLLFYMLASHTLGASWYLLSLGRQLYCWKSECTGENKAGTIGCIHSFLNCNSLDQPERQYWRNVTHVPENCDAHNDKLAFKFGIFADAFTSNATSSPFAEKYLYCLWWGLRNLSSYGQDLATSMFLGENMFCIVTSIIGLILAAQLIGNMQTNLQSMTMRVEEWRIKRRDTEEWMRHRQLPPDLKERVRRFVQYKWFATRGVREESILCTLPWDLRREIQRHLCLALVRRVPLFSQMDDQLLDAICERLVVSLSTEGTHVFREGDPINEMLFIIRGQLESSTTNGGRSDFFNSITLRPGDFCGEELLTWALLPKSSANLPSSTWTVRALCEVEAFALHADDLVFVAHQFKRLQSRKLQHVFRYYSHQWRTWAACLIQSVWRKHHTNRKNKNNKRTLATLGHSSMVPQHSSCSLANDAANVPHLGATFLASKFAANARRGAPHSSVHHHLAADSPTSFKMPQLFKPADPDFSVDE